MEATSDEGLLKTIRPPRLEDAGLEDCALAPDAIKEAFLKAANSIRSRASSILTTTAEEDDDEEDYAMLGLGISPAAEQPGPCGNEKGGGLPQAFGNDIVIAGIPADTDNNDSSVLGAEIPSGEGGKLCVEKLQGLKIKDDYEQDNKDEGPILAETYV